MSEKALLVLREDQIIRKVLPFFIILCLGSNSTQTKSALRNLHQEEDVDVRRDRILQSGNTICLMINTVRFSMSARRKQPIYFHNIFVKLR